MKVIGAGFARTGTLSLKTALEDLGFSPCHHFLELFRRPEDLELWERAARGQSVDWKALFTGWEAAVDWPTSVFYAQLLEVYPEAKVVLTVREPEKWYESAKETVYAVKAQADSAASTNNGQAAEVPLTRAARIINELIWEGMFHGRFSEESYALDIFNQNIADAKRIVPANQLLIFDVRQGWAPLCEFLGVPVPEGKPFPRVNDRNAFLERVERMQQGATR